MLRLPELGGPLTLAATPLLGGSPRQSAESFQLVAVAQAVIQLACRRRPFDPARQLPFPPVHAADGNGDRTQGDSQPETGEPVLAEGQGGEPGSAASSCMQLEAI